jgi:ABC-2 type transport system ATP-binding protein
MIEIRNLRKTYGSTVAVDDVSLDIAAGQTFGLLGPNGAGKTTLMHLLTGALRPDSGTIQLLGGSVLDAAIRAKIALAPQALALYDGLTAAENLAFFGKIYGLAGARLRERVDSTLDFAGLTDRRNDRVGTFSGGMKRRLNLACALIHDPEILFLDEPTAGVDPQSRNHLLESIAALAVQGRTVIYTTHYMEEAERVCQRVAIMDHGKILAVDAVPALIERFGGRSTIEADLEAVPTTPVEGQLDGTRLRVETDQPYEAVARMATSGLRFHRLDIARPNLETVFLTLTGRSLRD